MAKFDDAIKVLGDAHREGKVLQPAVIVQALEELSTRQDALHGLWQNAEATGATRDNTTWAAIQGIRQRLGAVEKQLADMQANVNQAIEALNKTIGELGDLRNTKHDPYMKG